MSLSLCIAIFRNVFDKSVGLSGRKTIMEAWNAQYAMCLAYFDSHCCIAFDEKISGVSIKSFCLLLKIQDWPSEDYNATPVTAIIEALSGDLETHQLDTLLLTHMNILSASTGPTNRLARTCIFLFIPTARHTWLLMPIANSQLRPPTILHMSQCHNVTMSQCHNVTYIKVSPAHSKQTLSQKLCVGRKGRKGLIRWRGNSYTVVAFGFYGF